MRIGLRFGRRRDEASCREVARFLQLYLDGQLEDFRARRVARHLERCRRCGMEAETYEAIKAALARRAGEVDHVSLQRLKDFGQRMAEGNVD